VQSLTASMPVQDYAGMSLYNAVNAILAISGANFYVDDTKMLHTFLVEAAGASFSLSDTPNNSTTFGYIELSIPSETTTLSNAIYLIPGVGGTAVPTWYTDATSITTYGRRETSVQLSSITVQGDLDKAGASLLAANKSPDKAGSFVTYHAGLAVGQITNITNADFGLSAQAIRITEIDTTYPTASGPRFVVYFGDYTFTSKISSGPVHRSQGVGTLVGAD
jgi:hypothetical protein